jgi:hypothetical protein
MLVLFVEKEGSQSLYCIEWNKLERLFTVYKMIKLKYFREGQTNCKFERKKKIMNYYWLLMSNFLHYVIASTNFNFAKTVFYNIFDLS